MRYALMLALGAALAAPLATSAQAPEKPAMSADHQFAVEVGQVGVAEIELGTLASQKASNAKVTSFGQTMVVEHTKAADELKTIATAKHITLPARLDATHQALKDRLAKMNGAAFDRLYISEMVKGHEKAVAAFRKESETGADAEIKAFAAKTLPTIERHLKMAQDVQKEIGPAPTQ